MGEMVVDRDEAIATAIRMRDEMQARITELEAQVERLEAAADPEALVIVYGKGRVDEQKRSRKRIAELEAQLAETTRWEPVKGTLSFESNDGLKVLLSATEINAEIGDKVFDLNFSDDEPLLRLCEGRRTTQEGSSDDPS